MSQRAVQANTATMDNARVAKDSASYLESLPQASTPTVGSQGGRAVVPREPPSLEAAVAAPAAVKPTPTPAELAAAAAPVKLASGAEAEFAAPSASQCINQTFAALVRPRLNHDRLICAQVRRRGGPVPRVGLSHQARGPRRAREGGFHAGIGTKDEGACLAEGFEFCAPVVGPLPKEEYLKALASFKLEETFDLNAQYHLFRVDPTQTNRVWFHTRTLGKHVNDSRFRQGHGQGDH